jgi:hypothetical protein
MARMFEETVSAMSARPVLGEHLVEREPRGEDVVANMTDILQLDECTFPNLNLLIS